MGYELRKLETLDGFGTILRADGSEFGKRRYHIIVYEEIHDVGGGEKLGGRQRIEGHIALNHMATAESFVMTNAELTLRLEDGPRCRSFLRTLLGRFRQEDS